MTRGKSTLNFVTASDISPGYLTCPDGRDAITKHMLALPTHLGHSTVANTYWFLEAVAELMRDSTERTDRFMTGGQLSAHTG
jgi:hypothetical protein